MHLLRQCQSIRLSPTIHRFKSSNYFSNVSNIPPKPFLSSKSKRFGLGTLYTATTFSLGYLYAQNQNSHNHHHHDDSDHNHIPHVLPSGKPRTCCDEELSPQHSKLLSNLEQIVGSEHCLTPKSSSTAMAPYLIGTRLGQGSALCVIRPKSISETLKCLRLIVEADCVVIPQGANTGLTGGSVPRSSSGGDNRPSVVINMRRMNHIHPVDDGKRLLCYAGAGIATAHSYSKSAFDRESHSILGSLFLNPTVAAGVAFGSGGTQMRKGPSYTDRALYVKIQKDGKSLQIMNTLGLRGFSRASNDDEDGISEDDLLQLEHGEEIQFWESIQTSNMKKAHDDTYAERLCDTEASNLSRYNADISGSEVNRSEGKVLILASVHDTFAPPKKTDTYFLTFDSLELALKFRKEVALDNPKDVPISMEYMDRDSFDVIDEAGRIMGNLVSYLGAGHSFIGQLWDLKAWMSALPLPYADIVGDYILYQFNNLVPEILPKKIMYMGRASDHHIMMTVGEFEEENEKEKLKENDEDVNNNSIRTQKESTLSRFNKRLYEFNERHLDRMALYKCKSSSEVDSMQAFRFVAAPAFRTWCVGTSSQGISVDYALPGNKGEAPSLSDKANNAVIPLKRMRYSHLGCNVVHEDLAYARGVDVHKEKNKLKHVVESECGGKLPAEHGHGTEYIAPEETKNRWQEMDPSNSMNPGIGGLKTTKNYN